MTTLALGLLSSWVSAASDAAPEPVRPCRLATYAYGDFDRAAALQPLADWLQARTHCAWRVEVLGSPGALAEQAAAGELEWAVPNLVGFLEARRAAPALLAPLRVAVPGDDAERYRSVLLARRGELADLDAVRRRAKTLRLGLTLVDSASGGLVPRALLAEVGLDAERDFAMRRYTGRHDASLRGLLDGELDLVGVPQDLLSDDVAPKVAVLARSAPIPVGPMLCGGLIEARCRELGAALAAAPEAASMVRAMAAAWPEFGAARGFESVPESEYAALLVVLSGSPAQ